MTIIFWEMTTYTLSFAPVLFLESRGIRSAFQFSYILCMSKIVLISRVVEQFL